MSCLYPRCAASDHVRFRPRLEVLEDRLLLTTYTVTNTNDSGPGSLRQAIMDANGDTGRDIINFQIGSGRQTIFLQEKLRCRFIFFLRTASRMANLPTWHANRD